MSESRQLRDERPTLNYYNTLLDYIDSEIQPKAVLTFSIAVFSIYMIVEQISHVSAFFCGGDAYDLGQAQQKYL